MNHTGNVPHENMMPYVALNFQIVVIGIYPSDSNTPPPPSVYSPVSIVWSN